MANAPKVIFFPVRPRRASLRWCNSRCVPTQRLAYLFENRSARRIANAYTAKFDLIGARLVVVGSLTNDRAILSAFSRCGRGLSSFTGVPIMQTSPLGRRSRNRNRSSGARVFADTCCSSRSIERTISRVFSNDLTAKEIRDCYTKPFDLNAHRSQRIRLQFSVRFLHQISSVKLAYCAAHGFSEFAMAWTISSSLPPRAPRSVPASPYQPLIATSFADG
jgi:hypothetical protein